MTERRSRVIRLLEPLQLRTSLTPEQLLSFRSTDASGRPARTGQSSLIRTAFRLALWNKIHPATLITSSANRIDSCKRIVANQLAFPFVHTKSEVFA
jgi:hypothetical protein